MTELPSYRKIQDDYVQDDDLVVTSKVRTSMKKKRPINMPIRRKLKGGGDYGSVETPERVDYELANKKYKSSVNEDYLSESQMSNETKVNR